MRSGVVCGRDWWGARAALLALLLAALIAQVLPAAANEPARLKILFIGNSHLFVNNVPSRVRRHLETRGRRVDYVTIAFGGARLVQHKDDPKVRAALKEVNWNVIVLQEATASFLSKRARWRFHQSVAWFMREAPTTAHIVLYQTWPWRTGSRFLRRQKLSSGEMWRVMQTEYAAASRAHPRLTIAPVGPCWMRAPNIAALYSSDGNHATVAGSKLAATIIADTIQARAPSRCPSR